VRHVRLAVALLMALRLATVASAQEPALDALVKDVCDRRIVLLGEDANHGSGATLAVKVELVRRLVTECHFSAVLFESQVYDFIDLEHAVAARSATPGLVRDAIGGLWSKARDTGVLAEFLLAKATARRVTLGGLDPQVGGATQRYTQQQLPGVLAAHLSDARARTCEEEFARLTNYRYNDSISYDAATRARLRSCVTDVQGALAQRMQSPAVLEAGVMARNLLRYFEMSDGDAFNVRDRAMFENLHWYLEGLAKDAKVIVWCATVHAAKRAIGSGSNMPLGAMVSAEYGDRAAAIGFSALGGSFGRPGRPETVLESVAAGSLEARAMTGFAGASRYVDREALHGYGTVVGRAINYRKRESADWSTVLDGVVVLREERPQQP